MLLLLLSRFSRVRLCVTPETAAHQAPPSMGFSRQEYWSGVHCLLQESGIARCKLLSWSVYFEKGGKPQVEAQMPIYIHMRQEAQALEDSWPQITFVSYKCKGLGKSNYFIHRVILLIQHSSIDLRNIPETIFSFLLWDTSEECKNHKAQAAWRNHDTPHKVQVFL